MDSKRLERSIRSNSISPAPPSPPSYGPSSVCDTTSNRRPSSNKRSPSPDTHRSSRRDSTERRRRRRSDSKSPSRHRRSSRSVERDRDRERSRKHSRRDRSRSRSRGRSRSRDRRRSSHSRERNRSRQRRRQSSKERRRHARAASYESDLVDEQLEAAQQQQQIVPAPQPNAFANDGSFMEMFKRMQEQMPAQQQQPTTSVLVEKPVAPPPLMVGKRRGGRILKTGMVAKQKAEVAADQPKDAWSLYMAEVKKYREVCCQEEDNTRPLVK